MTSVDVIIPVYKPDGKFDKLLERLSSQSIRPDRIILLWTIPEGEQFNDKMVCLLPGHDIIEVIKVKQSEFDHGGTRRLGVSYSSADYVLLMTQDAVPCDNNLIENLVKEFYNNEVAAVYGRQVAADDATIIERISREFNYPDKPRIQNVDSFNQLGIKTYFCSDVCAMYKRSYYDEAGGFIKKAIFNEDMIMAASLIKLGYTVIYTPDASVIHSHNYNYIMQYKRNFDVAVSQAEHPEVFENIKSESEGMEYVKASVLKLIKLHKFYMIPDFIILCGFKYMGFKKGKKYKKLSNRKILKYTMNKHYWK